MLHDVTYKTHSVLSGRVVDADGNPVPAAELVVARTKIPLGAGGGNKPFVEASRAVSAAGDDGSFSWHLPPSTTPNAKAAGKVEEWVLTATTASGTASRKVVVDRGETAELGDLVLG